MSSVTGRPPNFSEAERIALKSPKQIHGTWKFLDDEGWYSKYQTDWSYREHHRHTLETNYQHLKILEIFATLILGLEKIMLKLMPSFHKSQRQPKWLSARTTKELEREIRGRREEEREGAMSFKNKANLVRTQCEERVKVTKCKGAPPSPTIPSEYFHNCSDDWISVVVLKVL